MCIPSGAQTHESFRSPRALKTPETGHSRSPLTHLGASGAEGRVQMRRRRRANQQPLQWHGPALSPLEKHSRSSPRRSFCLPTPSARAGSSQSARGTASPWRARGKRERVFPRGDSQCTGSDPSRRVFFFFSAGGVCRGQICAMAIKCDGGEHVCCCQSRHQARFTLPYGGALRKEILYLHIPNPCLDMVLSHMLSL